MAGADGGARPDAGRANSALGDVGLAVDALGVDPEQHVNAVPGPFGDLRGVHSGVEPHRQAGVPEVVHPAGQRGSLFLRRQCGLPRRGPGAPVGDGGQFSAANSGEQASVRCSAEFLQMRAEQRD